MQRRGGMVVLKGAAEMFDYLTPNAEALLEEILSHRDTAGNCNSGYWKKRFENLSFAEDSRLRSTFKELIEQEMVWVRWADNYPYNMAVLNAGEAYSTQKARYEKTQKTAVRRTWVQCLLSGIVGVFLTLLIQNIIPVIIAAISQIKQQ